MRNTETQNIIVLPDIVKRYQDYVSQDYENNLNDNNSDNEFSIDNHFRLFNKKIIIQYMEPSYLYDIILKYSNHSNINHSKQIDRSTQECMEDSCRKVKFTAILGGSLLDCFLSSAKNI